MSGTGESIRKESRLVGAGEWGMIANGYTAPFEVMRISQNQIVVMGAQLCKFTNKYWMY